MPAATLAGPVPYNGAAEAPGTAAKAKPAAATATMIILRMEFLLGNSVGGADAGAP